jgi:hypothetical protein
VASSGALTRTAQARAVGAYDVDRKQTEDLDFWLRLCRLGEPVHVPSLVVVYRRHLGNRYGAELAVEATAAITRLAETDRRLLACRPDRLGTVFCEEALEALKQRRLHPVLEAWRRARSGDPDTPRILYSSARHFRRRRQAGALGHRVWEETPQLRSWLTEVGS